ncbi:MAG: hypothetical protein OEW75_09135, partial [Cyclobacteriaceae bacterium]|nr:hypothetical protein [Cyclobacteriaceae bacterium]
MLNSVVICILLSKDKIDLVWDIFNKHLKSLDEDIIIILIHDFDPEIDFLLTEKFSEITGREIQNIREFQPLGKGKVYNTSISDHFVYSKGFFIKEPESDYIHFTLPESIVRSVKKLIVIPFKDCTKIDKKTITKLQNFDAEIWCGCDYESYGLSEKYIDRQFKKEEFSNIIEEAIAENIKLRSSNEKYLNTILDEIKKVTKHDFSLYKKNTIIRRIERRITANKFRSLKQYTEYIKGHNSETEILHNSLLINVTEFFRDPNTFDYIS